MERLFNDEQTLSMKKRYSELREEGKSKNKSIEALAKEFYCSESTAANYVGAWGNEAKSV